MRPLLVALVIILIALGALALSGKLGSPQSADNAAPATETDDNGQDRFEVESGMASDTDPVPADREKGP